MKLTFDFGTPRNANSWVKNVNRSLRRQDMFNRKIVLLVAAMTACIFVQGTRIERLEGELEELKHQKEDLY